MGQAWYGVPAGDAALIRQANDNSNNFDTFNTPNDINNTPNQANVDPKFIQKMVEEAAAQVYEDVHVQLKQIQETSLLQTQQMSKDLQTKLKPLDRTLQVSNEARLCHNERSVLLQCLQQVKVSKNSSNSNHSNAHAALACEEAVQAYHLCSLSDK